MTKILKSGLLLAFAIVFSSITGCSTSPDQAVAINDFGTTKYGEPHLSDEALVVPIGHVSAKYNGSNFEIKLDQDQKIWTLRLVKNKKKQHQIKWHYEEAFAVYTDGDREYPIGTPSNFDTSTDYEAMVSDFKLKEKDVRHLVKMYEDVVAANPGLFDGPTIKAAKGENPLGLSSADLIGKFAPPIGGGTYFGWYQDWACYAANESLQAECSNQYCIGCEQTLGCTCICAYGELGCACEALGVACIGPVQKRGETYEGPRFDVRESDPAENRKRIMNDKNVLKS